MEKTIFPDVDSIQPNEEISEDLFLMFRDIMKEDILKFNAGGEWTEDGYVEFKGLALTSPTSTPPPVVKRSVSAWWEDVIQI